MSLTDVMRTERSSGDLNTASSAVRTHGGDNCWCERKGLSIGIRDHVLDTVHHYEKTVAAQHSKSVSQNNLVFLCLGNDQGLAPFVIHCAVYARME